MSYFLENNYFKDVFGRTLTKINTMNCYIHVLTETALICHF